MIAVRGVAEHGWRKRRGRQKHTQRGVDDDEVIGLGVLVLSRQTSVMVPINEVVGFYIVDVTGVLWQRPISSARTGQGWKVRVGTVEMVGYPKYASMFLCGVAVVITLSFIGADRVFADVWC